MSLQAVGSAPTTPVTSASPQTQTSAPLFDNNAVWGVYDENNSKTLTESIQTLSAQLKEVVSGNSSYSVKYEDLKKVAEESIKLNEELAVSGQKADELKTKLQNTKKNSQLLYGKAKELTEVMQSVFGHLKTQEGAKEDSKIKEAEEFLTTFITDLSQSESLTSSRVSSSISQSTPIQAEKVKPKAESLSEKLRTLQEETVHLINKALTAPKAANVAEYKKELKTIQDRFDTYLLTFEKLKRAVNNRLQGWKEAVEEHNHKKIPEAHLPSIAIFDGAHTQDVVKEVARREMISETRKKKNDDLAQLWTEILISKAAIEWNLKFSDFFANPYTNVKNLDDHLSKLDGDIEKMKEYLRTEVPMNSPDQLKKILHAKETQLQEDIKSYDTAAATGKSIRQMAEKTIEELTHLANNGGTELLESLESTHFFVPSLKEKAIETAKKTIASMLDKRKIIFDLHAPTWKKVFEKLDHCDNQKSHTYELMRINYAIKKNGGYLPADAGYKSTALYLLGQSWTPSEFPVTSPWVTDKKEESHDKKGTKKDKDLTT